MDFAWVQRDFKARPFFRCFDIGAYIVKLAFQQGLQPTRFSDVFLAWGFIPNVAVVPCAVAPTLESLCAISRGVSAEPCAGAFDAGVDVSECSKGLHSRGMVG